MKTRDWTESEADLLGHEAEHVRVRESKRARRMNFRRGERKGGAR